MYYDILLDIILLVKHQYNIYIMVDATSFIGHRRSRRKIIIILSIAIFLNVAVIARCSQ